MEELMDSGIECRYSAECWDNKRDAKGKKVLNRDC